MKAAAATGSTGYKPLVQRPRRRGLPRHTPRRITGAAIVGAVMLSAPVAAAAPAATSAEASDQPATQPADAHAKNGKHGSDGTYGGHKSRIPKGAGRGYDPSKIPERPERLTLFGEPFLGTGELGDGFEMPGGAVWRPRLHLFGTYRTALQAFNNGDTTFSEWANRLDLFGNLQLTSTERIVAGIQFINDIDNGKFSGYNFNPEQDPLGRGDEGWVNGFNTDLRTLFFEGEIGQLIPDVRGYESEDFDTLDIGFSVGRQPLFKQDGLLINDTVDSVGLTFNNIRIPGGSNLQLTSIYGWNEVHRGDNRERDQQHLLGLFGRADLPERTLQGDLLYSIDDDGQNDGLFWGMGSVQRMGHFNTAFRVLGSHATRGESPAVRDGYLLFGEVSWTPPYTYDNAYLTGFWGIDEFTSAARGPLAGGPLGQAGITFAAIGLGRYGAPITNNPDEAFGGAVGYRWLFDDKRTHLTVELGGRRSTQSQGDATGALTGRFQKAIGQHTIIQFDLFGSVQESRDPGFGGRVEFRYTF
jgi:hypothetical protein